MILLAGFLLGFAGSLHCVGMCGPIVLTAFSGSGSGYFSNRILYNSGRILTYSIAGFAVGLLGELIQVSGIQQIVSIVAGTIILLFTLFYWIGRWSFPSFNQGIIWLKYSLGRLLNKRGLINDFSLGLINGFLPCGLVYLALAGALMTTNIWESTLYMVAFGLGTFPAMFAMTYLAPLLGRVVNINKWIPLMFSIMGVLLIMRGLELGIPYISPVLGGSSTMNHM